MDLIRLAILRRIYTQSYADYIVEVFEELANVKDKLSDFKMLKQSNQMAFQLSIITSLGHENDHKTIHHRESVQK